MESTVKDQIYLTISALDGECEPVAMALIDWYLGVWWFDADVEFGEKCGVGRELPGLSLPLLMLLTGVSPNRGSNACRCMVPISDCPRCWWLARVSVHVGSRRLEKSIAEDDTAADPSTSIEFCAQR
jgi:hypothetical protein